MANAEFVINTFRTYIDEPDQTFVPNNLVTKMLQVGYNEFRNKVITYDPSIYARTAEYTLTDAIQLDLSAVTPTGFAGPIVGALATTPGERLEMLISAYRPGETTGTPLVVYNPVQSLAALQSTVGSYFFTDGILMFTGRITTTLRLAYVPDSNVSWDPAAPSAYIDDLGLFHDLIALYAYKQYAIADAAINEPLLYQLEKREAALEEYLTHRNVGSANYVNDVSSADYWL
ncbi:MAG: hypothetical protein Unbinned3620contig1001_16 [Prokaryotic dsDNA virus sp.]|nr:MAG: hypothetical protein Unbinned3620contig1001_16 [Prokaryotic dsDNA virus sp.]|tara:strand:- start:13495 stop:14187 length:693 start_codon:yes stop_codon:yes gene_type:complete